MNGFFKFVVRGNVIGLAVGVVIGAAFSAMVGKFVAAFLTPLIGLIGNAGGKYEDQVFSIGKTQFAYGAFVDSLISFVLTAAVIYFLVVLPVNKLTAELNPHHDLSKSHRACPECLQQIPALARRCSFCTSHVEAITDEDSTALHDTNPGEISLDGALTYKPAPAAEGAAKE